MMYPIHYQVVTKCVFLCFATGTAGLVVVMWWSCGDHVVVMYGFERGAGPLEITWWCIIAQHLVPGVEQ